MKDESKKVVNTEVTSEVSTKPEDLGEPKVSMKSKLASKGELLKKLREELKRLNVKKIKEKAFFYTDKLRNFLSSYFVADGSDNEEVRKKHKRVGRALIGGMGALLIVSFFLSALIESKGSGESKSKAKLEESTSKRVDIKNLNNGASVEETWLERSEKDLLELKSDQKLAQDKQDKLSEYLSKESVSKKQLAEILRDFEKEIVKKYEDRAASQGQSGVVDQPQGSSIEVIGKVSKKKVKKVGAYIPAGSYVEAKMTSGIDAGVGISAESNPRQVLLRIVGKVVSAGFGKEYLTTNKLMGCVVQCQVVGDLSSEKAYLKPVLMTCANTRSSFIEIPVKGYVISNGKVGIRGKMKERGMSEVTNSFMAGIIGGLGSGASQALEPGFALSGGGFAVKESGTDKLKNIFGSGLGKGLSESSNRLSDYYIKRAEQYQPVIEIDEGVGVELVFQEGFSLKEEDNE